MTPDRSALRTLLLLLGAGNVAHGLVMLAAPDPCFARNASDAGPCNAPLLRDDAAAGVALLFAALRPAARGPLAAAAAVFLGLHAGTHLVELFSGHSHGSLLLEVLGVHLPALLVVVLAAAFLRRPAEVY
jgi:predicted anti-sigma-YlaC factor YlaD